MPLATIAFVPTPGGPELLVILFIAVLYLAVPILLVIGGIRLYRNMNESGSREEELERRVEKLEREVESLRSDDE